MAYTGQPIRTFLKDPGIEVVTPHKENEKTRHDPEVEFDKATYMGRSLVEQSIGWLKECG